MRNERETGSRIDAHVSHTMPNTNIFTRNARLITSLERYLKYVQDCTETDVIDGSDFIPKEVSRGELHGSVPRIFRQIANALESECGNSRRLSPHIQRHNIAIIDLCDKNLYDFADLTPLDDKANWAAIVAMLVLAFPEVHWVFITPYRLKEDNLDGLFDKNTAVEDDAERLTSVLNSLHTLGAPDLDSLPNGDNLQEEGEDDGADRIPAENLCNERFTPLFDPTGLRSIIRLKIQEDIASIPVRPVSAAAIDDEPAYAHFNAYTARRFGYRGWAVMTWSLMERLFDPEDAKNDDTCGIVGIELLLEDLYCSFSDRPSDPDLSLSLLKSKESEGEQGRDDRLPALRSAEGLERRVIVTVGHEREKQRRNRQYLRDEWIPAGDRRTAKMVQKPLSGMFDFWRKAGMWEWKLWSWNGRPETAKDFKWPLKPRRQENSEPHSAPGRLLVIAERLIERSKTILEEAQPVPEAMYAATLALEAKELLANRTPTTTLEALTLQHRAEVQAESMFHGIEFNLDVQSRFAEIKREVEAIGRWFSGRRRKRVTLNARLAIIEDLAREFSERDQFEEERKCRAEARRLYFNFWAHQSTWRLPFKYLLRYLSLSLRSLPVFFCLIAFWIVFFGVGYNVLDPYVFEEGNRTFAEAFSTSTVYFFTLQMPGSGWYDASRQVLWNSILAFQSVVSLSHLGILVSHIYLIVSRR